MPSSEIRVTLDEADFRKLVAGRIVETEVKYKGERLWLSFALKDIGYEKMVEGLRDAMESNRTDPPTSGGTRP